MTFCLEKLWALPCSRWRSPRRLSWPPGSTLLVRFCARAGRPPAVRTNPGVADAPVVVTDSPDAVPPPPLPPVVLYPAPVYTGIIVMNPPENPDYVRRRAPQTPAQTAPPLQPSPVATPAPASPVVPRGVATGDNHRLPGVVPAPVPAPVVVPVSQQPAAPPPPSVPRSQPTEPVQPRPTPLPQIAPEPVRVAPPAAAPAPVVAPLPPPARTEQPKSEPQPGQQDRTAAIVPA